MAWGLSTAAGVHDQLPGHNPPGDCSSAADLMYSKTLKKRILSIIMMLGMKFILIQQTFMLVFCMMDQSFVSLYTGRDGISAGNLYSLCLSALNLKE